MNLLSARQLRSGEAAGVAVTALYAEHALGLTRLAHVMLGDRAAAEDVVHDAFAGLYRRWGQLADPAKAQGYLRSTVLNGCRSALRRAGRAPVFEIVEHAPDAESVLIAGQARAACSLRCGDCQGGSGRRSCCATTSTFRTARSRR